MKDEIGGKAKNEFAALRVKTYSCMTDNNNEKKKAWGIKGCVVKRKFKFIDYKHCLEAT